MEKKRQNFHLKDVLKTFITSVDCSDRRQVSQGMSNTLLRLVSSLAYDGTEGDNSQVFQFSLCLYNQLV